MLRQTAVCITDAPSPSMLRSMYGPIFVFLGTVLSLLVVYMVGKRLLLGPPTLTDNTLRATCISSGYSRMDDDPVEYRISVSLDLDTNDLASRLRNDDALTAAHKLQLKDIRKLKLVSATPLYTTYVAQHLAMKADIKVLTPTASPMETLAHLSGLVHEIRVLARLSHPKVVSLLGYAASSSLLDLTMATEFMSFGSLAAILSEPALKQTLEWTPTSIHAVPKVQLALDVVSAIVYLHGLTRPLLHNALSTNAVVVSSKWEAKVSAFAHSSYVDDASSSTTTTTELLPSAVAMDAPEVQSGGRRSTASDMYLLGHVLLALDDGDEATSTMPEAIATIVARCVDTDPTHRPTAVEVCDILKSFSD
ncbi:TKL protein kinase [Saprolegnia parasitica CBS 223.65]|uniref:TKL protein kinase n=1 Tax=Saprolegnia parasitica (strain CBS 223.65) TaxID=695850 RepID=A0A067CHR4_SAPPC|nr:TKL protein kinase [Saprolegnia parasitica CBS 223.65]KDO26357.1 TKL protein kinase [Saprolegnia parasitica CBS 223.65]|eukprot:XP_012203055.1 TKL protein kinase [Saprolegnia parasitica CBS 223.65]